MGGIQFFHIVAVTCAALFYCGTAAGQLPNLLPATQVESLVEQDKDAIADQPITLNPINDYLRSAASLELPLAQTVELSQNSSSFAFAIPPPARENPLWSIRYQLNDDSVASAVTLRLVTITFDNHQRVLGYESLMEQNGLGEIVVDEVLWPDKPVYVLVSANPPSQATLEIKAIEENWAALGPGIALSDNIAAISNEAIAKKTEFTWNTSDKSEEQALWDLKLVSEPGTNYSLQLRSGNQSAAVSGAENESLSYKNLTAPESELRLAVKPVGKLHSRVAIILQQQPAVVANREAELQAPGALSYDTPVNGVISHRSGTGMLRPETDTWILEVPLDPQLAEPRPTQIQLIAEDPAKRVKLSLLQAGRSTPLIKSVANGELNTGSLGLQPGTYTMNVSSESVGTAYRLKASWAAKQKANRENEPNNTAPDATPIASRKVVKGELTGPTDEDYFQLDTSADGAAQYWRLITTGGGVKRIALSEKYWISAHKDDDSPTLSMDYMLLLPGIHTIQLSGNGRYALRAIPLGPPKPGFEIEPNDGKLGPSGRLSLGEPAKGTLDKAMIAGRSDIDRYRFEIKHRGKYRLTIHSPEDQAIRASLFLNGSSWFSTDQTIPPASTTQYSSLLLAGEYIVELTNLRDQRALDEYSIILEKLADNADVENEPNDIVGFGTTLESTGTIAAHLGPFDQKDCYALSPTAETSTIELRAPKNIEGRFLDKYSASKQAFAKSEPANRTLWSVKPHAEALFFCVSGARHITDKSEYSLDVKLGPSIPEPKAQIATTIIPDAMVGGLNVAWHGLGARWESTDETVTAKKADAVIKKLNRVINNISPFGSGAQWDAFTNNASTYRLNLAGDDLIPLEGVVINTRTDSHARRKTRRFSLLVSDNGSDFSEVMLGELSFTNDDQYLAFEEPVSARYIKFLPLDSFQSRPPHYARFQELKLIASAGYSPAQRPIDLASPSVGGHVVRHDFKPVIRNNTNALDNTILDPQPVEGKSKTNVCQFPSKSGEATWVVGFHHNRAARVAQMKYIAETSTGSAKLFESVVASVSTESPLGPWREVARWNSEQLSSNPTISMPETPWIRFIRFDAVGTENTAYTCPHDIVVREADAADTYSSILGEWSEYGSSGPYEATFPSSLKEYAPQGGENLEHAVRISRDIPVTSSVKRERNDDWFTYQPQSTNEESNSIVLKLAHPISFKPFVNIRNATGEVMQPLVEQTGEAFADKNISTAVEGITDLPQGWTMTNYTVWTAGDTDYSVHIQEPPRNVVLTWDSSGSMGPQLPYIEMASRRWADYLKPDHEFAKVMKFAQNSYPENEWANLPHMLQGAMHSISKKARGSSDAENSLLDANELLAPRYGNHSIVVTTDGEFKRSKDFWDAQDKHCATMYAAGLAAAAAGEDFVLQSVYQDNFQNWVSACGGYYKYCDSVTCLEDFYEFAALDIRRAKPYQLTVEETLRAPPEPGLVSVIGSRKSADVTAKALYVILDASGSMLQQLEGKRRIEIAKETLKKVVKESVGKQNHFGMRTFGLEVDECRHTLTLPIAKHSAKSVDRAIDSVSAVNKAKTPIAASLEAAAIDLTSYSGEKVIVLLTDGEETCDGDTEAILTSLRAQDLDVKMHIVGFALDDDALVQQFKKWTEIGGGQYYEAGNQSALQKALNSAFTPRFQISNSVGDIVLSGYLGDPKHPLPPGSYVVALPDYPELQAVTVELAAGTEQVVEFK